MARSLPLHLVVDRPLVIADFEVRAVPRQALRGAEEQVSARVQGPGEPCEQVFLERLGEIDRDVAAHDDVEGSERREVGLEVEALVRHHLLHRLVQHPHAPVLLEVAVAHRVVEPAPQEGCSSR